MFNQQDQLRNALYFTLYSVVRKGKDDICSCFISVLYVMLLQYGATFFEDIFATFAISPKTVLDFFQNLAKLAATFTTLILVV